MPQEMYENICLINFFQSQKCKYHKIGKIAKNAKFSCMNFGVFCNLANFELFALLGLLRQKIAYEHYRERKMHEKY